MKLFVCEYFTGGGLIGKELSSNFIKEGELMVQSLLTSLGKFQKINKDIEFLFSRDYRLKVKKFKNHCLYSPRKNIWDFWESCIEKSDAFWPIAPETDDILEKLSAIAVKRKKILIGSSPKTIRKTKDKYLTNKILQRNQLRVIPSYVIKKFSPKLLEKLQKKTWILKPKDGAGADGVFIIKGETNKIKNVLKKKIRNKALILQPYIPGKVVSLSAIFVKNYCIPLTCNKMIVKSNKGQVSYHKIEVGGAEFLRNKMTRIANKIHGTFNGLSGYVGIDFIEDKKNLLILEINPRLTTSYVGLEKSINLNPVQIILGQLYKNFKNTQKNKEIKLTVKKVVIDVPH